ncbi:MAG: hypothetical protein ACP5MC_01035 [Candidatus Micrarchaeia archaeon]
MDTALLIEAYEAAHLDNERRAEAFVQNSAKRGMWHSVLDKLVSLMLAERGLINEKQLSETFAKLDKLQGEDNNVLQAVYFLHGACTLTGKCSSAEFANKHAELGHAVSILAEEKLIKISKGEISETKELAIVAERISIIAGFENLYLEAKAKDTGNECVST